MDELGLYEEKQPLNKSVDDIPEAIRSEKTQQNRKFTRFWRRPLLVGGGIGLIILTLFTVLAGADPFKVDRSSSVVTDPPISPSSTITEAATENLLGHLPYPEAEESDLQAITTDGRIRLRKAAAKKFLEMKDAGRKEGVILVPISGFRSIKEQESLFFAVAKERGVVPTTRAEVSAPPGYSEHHTGYTIDIGDGRTPATNLDINFEKTAAFAWLEENAAYYGFELSFPRDNPQEITYEPWHWRFVGDRDSLETFYKARNLDETTND